MLPQTRYFRNILGFIAKSLFVVGFVFIAHAAIATTASDLGYAPLSPLPGTTDSAGHVASFGSYVVGIFKLALGLSAILAIIMIVVAGTERMASGASESLQGSSRERMTAAIVGLIIAFSGWMILNTIYPPLTNINVIPPVVSVTAPPSATPATYHVQYTADMCPSGKWCYIYLEGSNAQIRVYQNKYTCGTNLVIDKNNKPNMVLVTGSYASGGQAGTGVGTCVQQQPTVTGQYYFSFTSLGKTSSSRAYSDVTTCNKDRQTFANSSLYSAVTPCTPQQIHTPGTPTACPSGNTPGDTVCCFNYIHTGQSSADLVPTFQCATPSKTPLSDCQALQKQHTNPPDEITTSCYKYVPPIN